MNARVPMIFGLAAILVLAWPAWAQKAPQEQTRTDKHRHRTQKSGAQQAPPAAVSDKEIAHGLHCGEGQCEVDRALFDKLLANGPELTRDARVVPVTKEGQPSRFKIYGIRPGSIFDRLGLRNGDLLRSINGLTMNDPVDAMATYARLLYESHFTLKVERAGSEVSLEYRIR